MTNKHIQTFINPLPKSLSLKKNACKNRKHWIVNYYILFCMLLSACYRPQTKLREGNAFTPVCQSFCSRREVSGSGSGGIYPPRSQPPSHTHPVTHSLPLIHTPDTLTSPWTPSPRLTPPLQSTSGWYASYWNAFLLFEFFTI